MSKFMNSFVWVSVFLLSLLLISCGGGNGGGGNPITSQDMQLLDPDSWS